MAISFSITTVVLTLIGLFVFWSTIKRTSSIAPEIANDALTTVAVAVKAIEETAIVSASEHAVETRQRMKAISESAKDVEGMDVLSMYRQITSHNI